MVVSTKHTHSQSSTRSLRLLAKKSICLHTYLKTLVFAQFSGHCQALAPEYEAAAKILSEQESKRIIAKMDATENPEVSEMMQIEGYPTF